MKKRAEKMLIPYAVFAVIDFGIMLVFDSWKPGLTPFDFAMKYVYYTQPPALRQTWFLVALLISSVLFYISCRVVKAAPGMGYEEIMAFQEECSKIKAIVLA